MSSEAQKWVTVTEVADEIDAHLIKGLLEESGIRCVIEASIYRPRSVAPIHNIIKLNVPADQFNQAKKILLEIEKQ